MADAAQMNGPSEGSKYIDSVDPDNPDYKRELIRPAEVKEDVKQMENRKRVSLILNSQAFREELEQIVESQIKEGPHPASLIALQQISDMLLPHVNASRLSLMGGGSAATPIIPINDIRGVDSISYNKGEKLLRCKVASMYRLADLLGWSQLIYNHISARITQEQEHFLINPFGLLYHEITAASLVKIDMQGNVLDRGSTTLGVNQAGFTIHSAIHAARPDIRCIIHLHHPAVVAVSIMKKGMLPISQEALNCGEVSYHDYRGIVVNPEDREALSRDLGPINKVMFLRNHGVLACGATVEEAFHYAYSVVYACETQVKVMPLGLDNIIEISKDVQETTFAQTVKGVNYQSEGGVKFRLGELQFEALMRHLDNTGFKTGYVYRQPVIRQPGHKERLNKDVEYPPSATSYMYDEQEGGRSPLKEAMEVQKKRNKSDWLNTPNTYQKTELDEIGTDTPKKIVKWVPGSGDTPGSSIRIENPNQFAPQGSNPKELKQTASTVRKGYYEEKISAGPQSKILEGTTWDEANKNSQDANTSLSGEKVIIVGAASKGIIQRDQQHNVTVFHSKYASNPFQEVKDGELEAYKKEIEHKFNPDASPGDEVDDYVKGADVSAPASLRGEHLGPIAVPQQPLVNGGTDPQAESTPERTSNETQRVEVTTKRETSIDDVLPPLEPQVNTSTKSKVFRAHSHDSTVDDIFEPELHHQSPNKPPKIRRTKSKETNIDDILSDDAPVAMSTPVRKEFHPESPTSDGDFRRTESARFPPGKRPELVDELKQNFDRSKSERKPGRKGEKPSSPTKSSGSLSVDTLDDTSTSKEGSPTKNANASQPEKKKKKKLRLPSFSKKKKEKKEKEQKAASTEV